MELQQSPLYAKYIESLKWNVLKIDGVQGFYKRIPLMGGLLKIQRPNKLPPIGTLISMIKKYSIRAIAIEPIEKQDPRVYKLWCKRLAEHCRVIRSEYMPTKTIVIDLRPDEKIIFERFSEAKRRAVRKAQKNGIIVQESDSIKDLIGIKNKSGGFFGFITTQGIDTFWDIMAPAHVTTVLARSKQGTLIGGVLLVFWGSTAYYWIAGTVKEGKKLFAPTLLVWESLRVAKRRGAKKFDFVGVWDERKANEHHDWKGFTKFKEGFGGSPLYYPVY